MLLLKTPDHGSLLSIVNRVCMSSLCFLCLYVCVSMFWFIELTKFLRSSVKSDLSFAVSIIIPVGDEIGSGDPRTLLIFTV